MGKAIYVGIVFLIASATFLATGGFEASVVFLLIALVNFGIVGYNYLIGKQEKEERQRERQRQRELRRMERLERERRATE